MKEIIVIDTNVLLNDPYALYAYSDAEIIIPQTVLSELDKLKMGRSDGEIRFRGREVSRTLFELSQHGSLLDGIELDNDALVRVMHHDPQAFPPALNPKNGDDRILSTAWLLMETRPEAHVVLLTNDLNMLLKAQTLGIDVEQHEHEYRRGFWSRFVASWRKRRVTLTWILVPIVLIGLFMSLWLFQVPSLITPVSTTTLATTSFPLREAQYLDVLKQDDSRYADWFLLGKLYLDWAEQLEAQSDFDDARKKRLAAAEAFDHTLRLRPNHVEAKTSLGTTHYFLGDLNEAISQYVQAIDRDPDYALAYFNLGFVLFQQKDYEGAARQFRAYVKLAPSGERSDFARERLQEFDAGSNPQI